MENLTCPACGAKADYYARTSDERNGYNISASITCSSPKCGVSIQRQTEKDKGGWCCEEMWHLEERIIADWTALSLREDLLRTAIIQSVALLNKAPHNATMYQIHTILREALLA